MVKRVFHTIKLPERGDTLTRVLEHLRYSGSVVNKWERKDKWLYVYCVCKIPERFPTIEARAASFGISIESVEVRG